MIKKVIRRKKLSTSSENEDLKYWLSKSPQEHIKAVLKVGNDKSISCHTFQHSFTTHPLESRYNIRTVQELLGHKDVKITVVYTNVLNRSGHSVRSPIDAL